MYLVFWSPLADGELGINVPVEEMTRQTRIFMAVLQT